MSNQLVKERHSKLNREPWCRMIAVVVLAVSQAVRRDSWDIQSRMKAGHAVKSKSQPSPRIR